MVLRNFAQVSKNFLFRTNCCWFLFCHNVFNMSSATKSDEKNIKRDFPKALEGFDYHFKGGQLKHMKTGGPFEFKVYETHSENQARYEALGEVLNEHVYGLLEAEGLERVFIPVDAKEDEPRSFFFMTPNALKNKEKLLILIHGSGVVRAGQWARRLIINDCLDSGTQLPYIRRAKEEGYDVIVMNTNYNKVTDENGETISIAGSDSPEAHGLYVWKHFVVKAAAKHVAIVAHSYGGIVTAGMAYELLEEFQQRVFAVGFTDSVHEAKYAASGDRKGTKIPKEIKQFYEERCRNWVTSKRPLDAFVESDITGCECVSAGHEQHEHTSWSAFPSVFAFLKTRLSLFTEVDSKKEL